MNTRADPFFLSDQETAVDLLYYEAIARTVVRLVRQSADVPVTIGVHGDWGAGKSSVLKMTAAAFEGQDRVITLWFNGWVFEGFEDAKAVVIETIVSELRRARPGSTKVAEAARKLLKRVDWLKVAQAAGGMAFTVATGVPSPDLLRSLYNGLSGFVADPSKALTAENLKGLSSGPWPAVGRQGSGPWPARPRPPTPAGDRPGSGSKRAAGGRRHRVHPAANRARPRPH